MNYVKRQLFIYFPAYALVGGQILKEIARILGKQISFLFCAIFVYCLITFIWTVNKYNKYKKGETND